MRLLDRYLLRELLVSLAYCLGFFLIIYVAFDLIFGIKGFLEKHLGPGDIAEYYLVTLPEVLVTIVIPVALLLALLYTLTNLSRHQELTAMRAAGVGLGRLSLPYFGVALFLAVTVFGMNELLVPRAADRAKEILQRHQARAEDMAWVSKLTFHYEGDGRQWSIDRYNRVTSEMTGVLIIWDRSSRVLNAQSGVYTNGAWLLRGVIDAEKPAPTVANPEPSPKPTSNAVMTLALPESPALLRSEIKMRALLPTEAAKKPQLSIREILEYVRLHPHQDAKKTDMLMTQLQGRVAQPFTCLAVVLIALPFGARSGRHNVFAGVASAVFICFAYFIMQHAGMGMGVGGILPPFLAAWLPNMVIGLTGLFLLWRAR